MLGCQTADVYIAWKEPIGLLNHWNGLTWNSLDIKLIWPVLFWSYIFSPTKNNMNKYYSNTEKYVW